MPSVRTLFAMPLLASIIMWAKKFSLITQLKVEDQNILFQSNWHLLFFFHFASQFSDARELLLNKNENEIQISLNVQKDKTSIP